MGRTADEAVRLRGTVSPLYVSIGHKMDLPTALDIVQSMAPVLANRRGRGGHIGW